MDTCRGVGRKGVAGEDEDDEVGEVGDGREGERELSRGDGDEVCEAGSVSWNDTEHGRCKA